MKLELDAEVGMYPNAGTVPGKIKMTAEPMQYGSPLKKQITLEINGSVVKLNLFELREACNFFANLP